MLGHRLRRASGGISPVALSTTATSTDATITIPAGAAVGDLAVLFDYAQSESPPPADVIPTDWTGIDEVSIDPGVDAVRMRASYKILAAGEPGSSITGMNGFVAEDKAMMVFRGAAPITSVVVGTVNKEATGGNPASQSVTASGADTPVIVLAAAAKFNATVAFSTASPAFDSTLANSQTDIIMGEKVYNSAPSNHTIDMNDLGNGNCLMSFYITVS